MAVRTLCSERAVQIRAGKRTLSAIVNVPEHAAAAVVFAHGSGSGRFSPRNQFVARALQDVGLATLLLDLLEENETENCAKVFDIDLLARRLLSAANWLRDDPQTRSFHLGFFGASTGAGAALVAAALEPGEVGAIVSRGGRPDLARSALPRVRAPTLLIIGGHDEPVLRLNQQALASLVCPRELVVVPGATHLFEEPGALEEVARLARAWFERYLLPAGSPAGKN